MRIHFFWWKSPDECDMGRYQVSNLELVKHGLVELSKYGEVVFHHSNARGRVTSDPDDILFGHPPYPTLYEYDNWMFDNGLGGPGSMHPNTFVVYPFAAADFAERPNYPMVTYANGSRGFFALGGLAHYDTSFANAPESSIWRRVQPKLIRANMGCDVRHLPAKTDFTHRPRGMLHVSSLAPYKRPELMFRSLPKNKGRLYLGTFSLQPIDDLWRQGLVPDDMVVLHAMDNGDPATNTRILNECSFYLHTAREPQATAILENCARGLVPILHPEAGFQSPHAVYLTMDPVENQGIIAKALDMPADEYEERSRGVRQQIRLYHSWQRIYMNMVTDMQTLAAGGTQVNRRGDDYS